MVSSMAMFNQYGEFSKLLDLAESPETRQALMLFIQRAGLFMFGRLFTAMDGVGEDLGFPLGFVDCETKENLATDGLYHDSFAQYVYDRKYPE